MSSRGRCLVIEDNEDIAGLLNLILTGTGFDVTVEGTGIGALQAAESMDLSLVTLDMGLPDMDGRDVAPALRVLTRAPILMITAYAGTDDELDGIASGATAYLTKPFRPVDLRAIVGRLCPETSGPDQDLITGGLLVPPLHDLTNPSLP